MKNWLFYITLFLLILAFSTTATFFDFDLWARLIAGMGVVQGGQVLTQDFLSYTPVHTWWDHEWGSGVIFYWVLKIFGPYSLIILQAIMMFGIFFISAKIIKLQNKNLPLNMLLFFFALMAVMPTLNNPIRCHMFSFLFFTLFIYILENVRLGKTKYLIAIPIITIFWNNIHGGVVSGLGLLGMYIVGEFLNKKPIKKYILTLLSSCLLLFINPWGYDYIKFLLMANTMKRPDIVEWWGIFSKFHLYKYIVFKIFMIGAVLVQIKTLWGKITESDWFNQIDKTKYIVLLSTMYLAISHVKLMPFFVISVLCFMYEDILDAIKAIKLSNKAVTTFLLILSIFTVSIKNFSIPEGLEYYPVKEVEFIKANKIKGNILSNFGYGSFISYKLYPQNKIFMDGRYEEVYYDYMVPLLKQFFLVLQGWDTVLKEFPPDIMIIEKNYPVFEVLEKSKDWAKIYDGGRFGIFVHPDKVKPDFVEPSNNLDYYKNNLFTTDIKF